MPPQPLVERALAAAIVVLVTVAGIVALAGGTGRELALGIERAAAAGPVRAAGGPVRASADVLASTVTVPTVSAPDDVAATTTVVTAAPVVEQAAGTTEPPTTTTRPPSPTTAPTTAPPSSAPATTAPTTTAPSSTTQPPAGTTRDAACESSMLGWMNEDRTGTGRGALTEDEAIQHVSLDWSGHMADTGELAHNPRFSDQIFAVRAEATTAGEVVGRSGESARAVFDEFMRSSVHRDTIRQPAFRYATVGCVRDGGGGLWVTANFWG